MKKFQLLLLSLILCMSCSKQEIEENSEANTVYIRMDETVSENGEPQLQLIFKTAKFYPCSNYKLKTVHSFSNSQLRAEVTEPDIPDRCLLASGPASAAIDWQYMEAGSYPIEITVFEQKNMGSLTIDDRYYTLQFSSSINLIVETEHLSKTAIN